jgi:tRNA U34 5-methylaminomethyl-2-thiouridine-forming methyltransferase MnmC
MIRKILTEDGSHTLYNESLRESYHSMHGALGESLQVYLQSGFEYQMENNQFKSLSIFEVGMGTGLNAMLTRREAEKQAVEVFYHAIETQPVDHRLAEELNYFSGREHVDFLKIHQAIWDQQVQLSTYFKLQKEQCALEQVVLENNAYHIIYFDAFAPSKQPEIWKKENLEKCFYSLIAGGVLVTYCAQGQFKRDLISIGFELEVLPGAMGKKEMVRAIKH